MLPKFLTHLDKKTTHHYHHHHHLQQQQQQRQRQATTRRRCWCCTFPLVVLGLILVLHSGSSNAEKDFNFNDSQVPLLEPKDEPILIDHQSSSSSSSSSISIPHQHLQHHNHHEHHHNEQEPYAVELHHCHDDKKIVLSLVLKNYNFNSSRKAKVLEKLSHFFAIPKAFITMEESVTKSELSEMQKESLKRGNIKCHNNNNSRKLGRVNFIIGCGSKYFSVSQPITKQIGQQVKDGALDNMTGEKIACWAIWHRQDESRLVRNRRQIEGSGDDDEDDDYYDYDDDTEDIDTTTSTTHAHRHHHGDDTSEINSNMLEVTNQKNDLQDIGKNKLKDDITALKQTDDPSLNEADEQEVEKTDSNLLLLNKKANIDEEIVESVSQLESVITKTIENTKNLEDVADIIVDQPEDDLLSEVLSPIDEIPSSATKSADNLNLNAVYETPNRAVEDNSLSSSKNREFNAAEVNERATTTTANSLTTTNTGINNSKAVTLAGVNVQEHLESFSDSTTPFSLSSNIDFSSSSSSNHGHNHHHLSPSLEPLHAITEITTSITKSHITPAILTDSTATTITTTKTTTSRPFDSSSTLSTTSTSMSSLTSTSTSTSTSPSASSSASTSSSTTTTLLSTVAKKDETTTNEPPKDLSKLATTVQSTDFSSSSVTTPASTAAATTQAATSTAAPTSEVVLVSSTTASPDYVEPKMENTAPIIKSRLQKLAVTSGKSFKLPVPEDTFYDNEDLTNLRLVLTDKEGLELKSNSWLQFNAETREIYGLPLDDAVSKWQYRLTATDSGNESVTETLEISVQQHRGLRTVNHEINVSVKINEKNMHYIDWQLNLINAIATTLGDANTNSIVVREIRASAQDTNTATLVYFNETLPTSECLERELSSLVKRLDVTRLSDLVQPILGIKSLTGQLIGPCQKTAAAKPKTPTLNIKNAPPVPRNQVDRVVATVGHLLVYKVPSDTFFDPNDSELTLSLKTKDHKELSPRHWLQFDAKNEEFYGIPKSGDIGSEEYMLVAEDAGGLTATDALVVQVNHALKRDFSVYIKVYLAIRHEQFNADLQRKFVERIANLFGDASTQNIQIRSVTTHHDSDGTIVNFFNTTLFKSHNRCPEEEMEALRSVYLQDYTVRERVKKALGPELNITNVQVIPLGTCNAIPDNTHREFVPNKTDEPLLKSTFSDDYMYTIILPAIIIVSMILIAAIIACCLHRRRRKSGKMELGDEEERKSFRTKGIPVIFQDELDEKPEIGNKSPIILKDEKPPLLPPSYNTSNMNGDNDVDEYVPPPAVVMGGREARGKSPATPSYRKPPPYVSP